MAKKQVKATAPDVWLKRATAGQVNKMREILKGGNCAPPSDQPPMTGPGAYRKRPVIVQADEFMPVLTGDGEVPAGAMFIEWPILKDERGVHLLIETPEGTMRADVGDWIITGVAGEKYPCKPDIFQRTYEPAGELAPPPPHHDKMPDIPRAYALLKSEASVGVPAWELLIFQVKDGELVVISRTEPNLRGVVMQNIEDDILKDV